MKSICLFSLILSLFFCVTFALEKPCGDWEPFRDEKCFKIFDSIGLQNFTEAEATCAAHDNGNLISISTKEEQEFLANFLFKQKQVVDTVWLGAKVSGTVYHWEDGSILTFTNWASGEPKNQADHCAQMNADGETKGKWVEAPCRKKNLVVCQKRQTLSLAHMQQILIRVEKELFSLGRMRDPVPIGFIYTQYPKEKAPADFWPFLTWTDVTSAYAGVFFRAEGGGADTFGSIQEENVPTIDKVEAQGCDNDLPGKCHAGSAAYSYSSSVSLPQTSGWSDYAGSYYFFSPSSGSNYQQVLHRYHTTAGEVRPRNMAIRVWKRTA